jgi:hypothetical protein
LERKFIEIHVCLFALSYILWRHHDILYQSGFFSVLYETYPLNCLLSWYTMKLKFRFILLFMFVWRQWKSDIKGIYFNRLGFFSINFFKWFLRVLFFKGFRKFQEIRDRYSRDWESSRYLKKLWKVFKDSLKYSSESNQKALKSKKKFEGNPISTPDKSPHKTYLYEPTHPQHFTSDKII